MLSTLDNYTVQY